MKLKLYIETYGCQMNVADSNVIRDTLMQDMLIETVNSFHEADILVMNTCSIRKKAEDRVYSTLGRWKEVKEKNPNAIIAIGGCVASQEGENIIRRAPFVDIVFGPQTLHRLPKLIQSHCHSNQPIVDISFPEKEKFQNMPTPTDRSPSVFVSIMEGCSKYCSFCIVPYTRGEEFSKDIKQVLQECQVLADRGVKEIHLLGQNVNDYESSVNGTKVRFADLIQYISGLNGIERIRFTTSHPQAFSQDLIDAYAHIPKLVNHLHLPVQSGSNRILSLMKRGYEVEIFEEQIAKLRKIRSGICISTDLIIGFPGETDDDFQKTIDLISRSKFDHSFSFIYSKRPGTPAADLDDPTPMDVKKERLAIVQEMIQKQADAISQAMIGTIELVLFESLSKKSNQEIAGKTENCRYVNAPSDESIIGKILPVKITSANRHFLKGIVISDDASC